MTYDTGIVILCKLKDINEVAGGMPAMYLIPVEWLFYAERAIGYGRQYAAFGANQQVDLLIRTWRTDAAEIGMYAVTEDKKQYRIDNVQHLIDEDGLKITDLTLRRLDKLYDVAE